VVASQTRDVSLLFKDSHDASGQITLYVLQFRSYADISTRFPSGLNDAVQADGTIGTVNVMGAETGCHVSTSHTRCEFDELVTTHFPSGLNDWIRISELDVVERERPVSTSHVCNGSDQPYGGWTISRFPSGLSNTVPEFMGMEGETGWPVAASHTRAVLSSETVANRFPSELNLAYLILPP